MGTAGSEREEDDPWGGHPSRLVDGKGLDGIWVYQPPHGAGPTVCAADPLWLSLELEVPYVVTKVQLARRINSGNQGKCIRISVGSSREYDPNDALCRPEIDELQHTSGLSSLPQQCPSGPSPAHWRASATGPWRVRLPSRGSQRPEPPGQPEVHRRPERVYPRQEGRHRKDIF